MSALRVGIIGGAGQVGSALLKVLNSDGELSAFGICRNRVSAARVASQGLPVRIAQTDNAVELSEATRDLDVLVNCALPLYKPSKTSASNQRLASSLATACAGKRLVHLSSVAVYGDFIPGSRVLFDHPRPDTTYGRQKLQMEHLLRKLAKKHSMKCTILRVGHVYGAELRWSETFFDLIKNGDFRLPFDGEIPSNAVWIKNLTAGIREVLINKPVQDTFNLIDSPQTTWREIFDLHSEACGSPTVKPLSQFESKRLSLEAKRRGQTGIAARLILETLAWVKHLPASYIASVPAFKAMSQWAVARVGSERLDARLWAVYCSYLAPRIEANSGPPILPILLSEPIPGPCLSYQGTAAIEYLAALQDWHNVISTPQVNVRWSILYPTKVANTMH
jgi:nucleoside-diphosphate-sugar epimerase